MDDLLITQGQLIQGTPMGGNIDPDKYSYVIKETQISVLEPILGTKLYNKIVADFQAGTLTGIYDTIHKNYVISILKHSVAAEYIIECAYNVQNGGVFKHLPQNGEPVAKAEVDFLTQRQRVKAQIYIDRLERFLCDQSSQIPEYSQSQDEDYDIKPDNDVNFLGGWHI